MEKLNSFFSRHRVLFVILAALAVFSLFALGTYSYFIAPQMQKGIGLLTADYSKVWSEPLLLKPGNRIGQSVKVKPGKYAALQFDFKVFERANPGKLEIDFESEDGFRQHWALNCEEVNQDGPVTLFFGEPFAVSEVSNATITLVSNLDDERFCPAVTVGTVKPEEADDSLLAVVNGKTADYTVAVSLSKLSSVAGRFFKAATVVLFGIAVLIFGLAYFWKKLSFSNLVLLILLLTVPLYAFVFTPNTVPDEVSHYASSYYYSNKLLFENGDTSTEVLMRPEDEQLISKSSTSVEYKSLDYVAENFRWTALKTTERIPVEAQINRERVLAYLPAAVGISVGRLLHLGAYPTYYCGRLFNMLFGIFLIWFAIRRIPFGKAALAAIALLPMTLHLLGSYSYDVYSVALLFLLFAELVRMRSLEQTVHTRSIIWVCVLAFLAIPYKTVYIAVMGLVFLIPNRKFASKPQAVIGRIAMIASGVFGILLLQFLAGFAIASDNREVLGYEAYTVSYLLSHIPNTVRLYLNTFAAHFNEYVMTMFGSSLSWVSVAIPNVFLLLYAVILFLSFQKRDGETQSVLKVGARWYTVLLTAGSAALVILSMVLAYTPKFMTAAYGVQGRYFIPLLPLVFLVVRNDGFVLPKRWDKPLICGAAYLNLFVLLECCRQLCL